MLRALLELDLGGTPYAVSDTSRLRWHSITARPFHHLTSTFSDSLSFLSLSTPHLPLLLTGGAAPPTSTARHSGALAIFPLPPSTPLTRRPPRDPLTLSVNPALLPHPLVAAQWLPDDPAVFVTGNTADTVSIWDTAHFTPVLHIRPAHTTPPPSPSHIHSIAMSTAPAASPDLLAVARSHCFDVLLVDMATGASTHRLQGHSADVTDLAWSPTNPYLLASCARDGATRLFDVRRAGHSACLVECVASTAARIDDEPMADEEVYAEAARVKRRRRARAVENGGGGVERGVRRPLLGMGCVWELESVWQRRRRRRRAAVCANGGYHSGGVRPCLRVRFSQDGLEVLSGAEEEYVMQWDVPTGRLIRRVRRVMGRRGGMFGPVFEVARDGFHLFTQDQGCLQAHNLEDGGYLWRRQGHTQPICDMAIHPLVEEVYTLSESQILCWAPAEPDGDGEEAGDKRGHGSPRSQFF